MANEVYWCGHIGSIDDYSNPISDEFIDGRTRTGPWAIMNPDSWRRFGGTGGRLGTGLGQRYKKQPDGRWLKVEG